MKASQHSIELDFEERIRGSRGPVLAYFWATWCGPCKLMSAVLTEVTRDLVGVDAVWIDVDVAPNLVKLYDVQNVPTLILFKDAVAVDRRVGALSKRQFSGFVAPHLRALGGQVVTRLP